MESIQNSLKKLTNGKFKVAPDGYFEELHKQVEAVMKKSGGAELILPDDYETNNPNIVSRIKNDLLSWRTIKPHYLFYGSVGCGKTILCEAILKSIKISLNHAYNELLEMEKHAEYNSECFYRSRCQLAGELSSMGLHTAMELHETYLKYENKLPVIPNIFILDDLGAEKKTDGAVGLMDSIITARYEMKGSDMLFIITTNLMMSDIANRYGSRIKDRFEDLVTVMKFEPRSFRREKREVIEG